MSNKFNQDKYTNIWKKEHMKLVGCMYANEFADEFKKACKKLGLAQSQVFRKAMEEVIEEAKKQN